jgi:alpha-D-ribose 1-methylphosphonate 5-triphosphate synthase subunit PhnL
LTDLALAHITNLDLISKGQADEEVLWQMVGGVLTWSRVAELLNMGVAEMAPQLELATRVVERYGRTGRVGFSGTEYQAAKLGVDVMDALAEAVDQPTASLAADWSEQQVNLLAARCRAGATTESRNDGEVRLNVAGNRLARQGQSG